MENNFEVVIFPLAQADMEEIFNYISNNLKNKIAAGKLINDFKRTIENHIKKIPKYKIVYYKKCWAYM